jgi:hypothetical protein
MRSLFVTLLLLVTARAYAKPAPNLIVPIAGNIHGAHGTSFKTDLTIRNSAAVAQGIDLTFLPADSDNSSGDGVSAALIQLQPHTTVTYEDVVGGLFARTGIGSILIQAPDRVMASYRIYTQQPGKEGTTSESADALPLSAGSDVSEDRIIGLIHDASFRTNIGIVNLDPTETRTFHVTAVGSRDHATMDVAVPPMSVHQHPLPSVNLGYVTVDVALIGAPSRYWTAYGSSIDNVTGDSWLQMIARSGIVAADQRAFSLIVPVAGNANGTTPHARTDVTLTNRRDTAQEVAVAYYTAGPFLYGDPRYETVVTLAPRSTATFLDAFFGASEAGTILINPSYNDQRAQDLDADLEATYRTWIPADGGGSMSQSAPALDTSALPPGDQARVIIGVKLDSDFACNVGIYADSYYDRKFRVTAASERGSLTMDVVGGSYAPTQVRLPASDLGYVTLTITPLDVAPGEVWTAYATSVDRRSGDSWLQNAYPD